MAGGKDGGRRGNPRNSGGRKTASRSSRGGFIPDITVLNYTYDVEALDTMGAYANYSNWTSADLPQAASFDNCTSTTYHLYL